MENKKERIAWFDFARTLAISLVILIHCVEEVFFPYLYGDKTATTAMTAFIYTLFTLGRLGVPIFLFLTGALLLNRDFTKDNAVIKFYKHNFLPLLLVTEFWIILYNLFNFVYYHDQITLKNILLELIFFKESSMPHMWYMYAILGLYIAIPFIALIVQNFSNKIIWTLGALAILYNIIFPNFFDALNVLGISPNFSCILDLSFSGGYYGIYILTGYYISKGLLKKINLKATIILFFTFIIPTIVIQMIAYKTGHQYKVWYSFILLYLASLFLMNLLSFVKIKSEKVIYITSYISQISLALYFIHIPVRLILIKYLPYTILPHPFALLTFFISVYAVSICLIYILSKNKYIKERILLIK